MTRPATIPARNPERAPAAGKPASPPTLTIIPGGRGVPSMVQLRRGEALAPAMEGVALADDVLAAVDRISLAIAAGSRQAAVNETFRLGHRASLARAEFRRLAGAIDGQAA